MKIHYYPETDSLYIELRAGPGTETREISDGLNVDLDAEGGVVETTSTMRRGVSTSDIGNGSPAAAVDQSRLVRSAEPGTIRPDRKDRWAGAS